MDRGTSIPMAIYRYILKALKHLSEATMGDYYNSPNTLRID